MLATTIHKSNTTPHHQNLGRQPNPPRQSEAVTPPVSPKRDKEMTGLLSQSPIVCLAVPSPVSDHSKPVPAQCLSCTRTTPTTGAAHPTNRLSHRTPTRCGRAQVSWCSLERR